MLDPVFYHGMSAQEWTEVQAQGRFSLRCDFTRWLAARGVYLFWNNPVLARRWALRKESDRKPLPARLNDREHNPRGLVVLKVRLKEFEKTRLLDLTSADGMQGLFWSHRRLRTLLTSHVRPLMEEAAQSTESSNRAYARSFMKCLASSLTAVFQLRKLRHIFEEEFGQLDSGVGAPLVKELLNAEQRRRRASKSERKGEFNFDCVAITLLVAKYRLAVVLAAIQEGKPLNVRWDEYELETPSTEGYKGIRIGDHIEVCVTDHSVIVWPPVVEPIDRSDYDEEYMNDAMSFGGGSENDE